MRINHTIPLPKTMRAQIVCSWCRTVIREDQWPEYKTEQLPKDGEVLKSHGMCQKCFSRFKDAEKVKNNEIK